MDEVADRRRIELTLMDDSAAPRRTDMARREAAAIEAGRWLRRTGRVSLPVRARRRAVTAD
jgi:hypothetical protein